MKGRDLPSYIHRRKRDGVLLFRKRQGKRIIEIKLETQFPDGEPVPFALYQERERLLNQPVPVAGGRDMNAVLRFYRASADWKNLAPRTKADYEKHLSYFAEKLGHLEPRNIETPHVLRWRDAWAEERSPHFANYRTRVLSIVMEQARMMGLLQKGDMNPAKGIKSLKYEKKERREWPETLVQKFRKCYDYGTRERLCFELLVGTGQRIGDVLKMQWGHIDGDEIRVTQNKTGKTLYIPITRHLAEALAATERKSLFILTKESKRRPGQWAYRSAAQAMRKAREAIGAEDYDLQGLRYTAAVELLQAGCNDDLDRRRDGPDARDGGSLYAACSPACQSAGSAGKEKVMGKARLGWLNGKPSWQCTEHVYSGESHDFRGHRCGNKATADHDEEGNPTKCHIHSAEGKRKRAEKRDAKHKEYMARLDRRDKMMELRSEAMSIIRKIAEGHNDPRGLCLDWVRRAEQNETKT